MVETLFFISGAVFGVLATYGGYLIAGSTIHRTFVELTHPTNTIDKEQVDSRPELPDGYDWDVYDKYIENAEEEDDIIPES